MSVSFRVLGLPADTFRGLFELDDEELRERGARRMTVDAKPGYPCRVSLVDAEVGEEVILTSFEHHEVDSPFRGEGPIFVRRDATAAQPAIGEIPEMLERRPISVRAYDGEGMMADASVAHGENELRAAIERMLATHDVAYLHLHNAGAGCFNCRVERA